MNCCDRCFADEYLINYIKENGEKCDCGFCGSLDSYCLHPKDMSLLFEPLIRLYTPIEDFMPVEQLKEWDGEFIWDKLQSDWDVFSDGGAIKSEEIIKEMFESLVPGEYSPQFLYSYVEIEDEFSGDDELARSELEELWEEISSEMKDNDRFLHKQEKIDSNILLELLQGLEKKIAPDKTLYRARNSYRSSRIPPRKMGMPPVDKARAGRANPVGIPYLYAASDFKTAIAEIRPSVTDRVTVGDFKVTEELVVIDLRSTSPFSFYLAENYELVIRHLGFLRKIGMDLTIPVNPKDTELDYLPTQYICEFIKIYGWDGVLYESDLGKGYNMALFRENKVECMKTKFYEVEKQNFNLKIL